MQVWRSDFTTLCVHLAKPIIRVLNALNIVIACLAKATENGVVLKKKLEGGWGQ